MVENCAICLNPARKTRRTKELHCGHIFHNSCISKWKSAACPVCRRNTNALTKYKVTIIIENNYENMRTEDSNLTDSTVLTILDRFNFLNIDVPSTITEIDFNIESNDLLQEVLSDFGIDTADLDALITDT